MSKTPFEKPHASTLERVRHLKDRGLIIEDDELAAAYIDGIGYERLRIYFRARRDPSKPQKPFHLSTTFQHIIRLYVCDEALRALCFARVGQFELRFRNQVSEVLSEEFGSHPYFQSEAFENATKHNEALNLLTRIFQITKDPRAKHYRSVYSSPPLPPIWTLKEFLTFGATIRLYTCLSSKMRGKIAKHFGISKLPVFESWLHSFVDLRNICAHHDRLFNRKFQKQPQKYKRKNVPSALPQTLKAQMECLDCVLGTSDELKLVREAEDLFRRYTEVNLNDAGFTSSQQQTLAV